MRLEERFMSEIWTQRCVTLFIFFSCVVDSNARPRERGVEIRISTTRLLRSPHAGCLHDTRKGTWRTKM